MVTEKFCKAINWVFWGTILVYLGYAWIGYIFLVKALWEISGVEHSIELLRPLGIVLGVWNGIKWIIVLFGGEFDGGIIGVLFEVLSLYFHYQLLTNMAGVAARFQCPQEKHLLHFRNLQAVILTVTALLDIWREFKAVEIVSNVVAFVHLFVIIGICEQLYDLKKDIRGVKNRQSMEKFKNSEEADNEEADNEEVPEVY